MHCPAPSPPQEKHSIAHNVLALIGNMNAGKSTLFAKMAKEDAEFDFPGTTVAIRTGHIPGTGMKIYLTPGTGSIFSKDEDDIVSRAVILPDQDIEHASAILLVADAKNLKRSLALALQYMEYGLPMLLIINMIDEAISRGMEINVAGLSSTLGIDVCPTNAREGIGIRSLVAKLNGAKTPSRVLSYPDWLEEFLETIGPLLPASAVSPRVIGLQLLAGDKMVEKYVENRFGPETLRHLKKLAENYYPQGSGPFTIFMGNIYNKKAEQLVKEILRVEPPRNSPLLEKLGDWCTKLHTGIPIAFAVLAAMYLFVGSFGATFVADTMNEILFGNFLIPLTAKLVAPIPSPFIRAMLIDPDFGILPTGVFLAIGLVMPVFFCFYIAFGFLQDSGYLPRLSMLLDKIFKKIGLNGKGVIPLVMGFSCVTMALLTTRMLGSKKERIIASILLLLGTPCAPLIAVMLIILGKMPFSATLMVFGVLFIQVFLVGALLNKILPGKRSPFIMEIPPLRIPKPIQVIKTAAIKTTFFMKEAVPVFVAASIVVFLFQRFGGLEMLEKSSRPLITNMLGLPEKGVQVFIKTLIRRESGAAELEHLRGFYTNLQLVINLLVMTFLTPCMNAVIVLYKERGTRTATIIISAVVIYAITMGSIINHVCLFLGVTFS